MNAQKVLTLRKNAKPARRCSRQGLCGLARLRAGSLSRESSRVQRPGGERTRLRIASRRHLVRECESLLMKIHLVQPQILLLQSACKGGKIIGEQRTQVAFFTADLNSNFVS